MGRPACAIDAAAPAPLTERRAGGAPIVVTEMPAAFAYQVFAAASRA